MTNCIGTQQELAIKLGVAQRTLAHYEVARIWLPASTLPQLATLFAITVNDLVDHAQQRHAAKRGPMPKWQQLEASAQLPTTQQRFVTQMLDTVLAQSGQWPFLAAKKRSHTFTRASRSGLGRLF